MNTSEQTTNETLASDESIGAYCAERPRAAAVTLDKLRSDVRAATLQAQADGASDARKAWRSGLRAAYRARAL